MSRLIKEVKSFGKSALLKIISVFIFSIFFSFPINVMAEEVPYWAGYKSKMTTDESTSSSNLVSVIETFGTSERVNYRRIWLLLF